MSKEVAPGFLEVQRRFAAHIRNPDKNPRPADVNARRMAVYTELFYRNIESFLAQGFPVIRRITPDERWHSLVRAFMEQHRCKTPLFPEIGREFVSFLESEAISPTVPPFLVELAQYEYLEVIVSFSEDEPENAALDPAGDLIERKPVISSSAHAVRYRFPVHRIGPDYQPEEAPEAPTCLIVYRDAHDRVRFMEINLLTYTVLQVLELEAEHSGRSALEAVAQAIQHPAPEELVEAGRALLEGLRDRGIVRGVS